MAALECPAHGVHPHNGATCLDCPTCRPAAERDIMVKLQVDMEPFTAALADLAEAHRAAGYAAGYARAVADTAAQIEAATGHRAGTPEEVIRWLVRTWPAEPIRPFPECEGTGYNCAAHGGRPARVKSTPPPPDQPCVWICGRGCPGH